MKISTLFWIGLFITILAFGTPAVMKAHLALKAMTNVASIQVN